MCTIGLKKTAKNLKVDYHILEVDELYWFIGKKGTDKTRENCYVIPLVSRLPRQIVGIDAAFDKSPERIQALVDNAPPAENYCTDGFWGYVDVIYPGRHIRNISNKNDTFTVESVNADLRHYRRLTWKRAQICEDFCAQCKEAPQRFCLRQNWAKPTFAKRKRSGRVSASFGCTSPETNGHTRRS